MLGSRTLVLVMLAICLMFNTVAFAYILGEPKIYVQPEHIPVNGIVNVHLTIDTTKGPPESDFLYAIIDQLAVDYPSWDIGPTEHSFMLGTATAGSIAGQPITVHIGDDFVIPFGPGVGAIIIDGQEYWWWYNNEDKRLDDWGQSPTQWKGKYLVDMAGLAYYLQYPGGQQITKVFFFDTWVSFTVPELGIVMAVLLGYSIISMKKKANKNQ